MRVPMLCLALVWPAGVDAAETAWLCNIDVSDGQTPIPPQIVIGHDTGTGSVVVNDPVIAQYVGIPMRGRVEAQDDRQIVFVWTLQGPADTQHPTIPRVDYRASIQRADGAILVRAVTRNAARTFTARGTCMEEDVDLRRRR